MLFIFEKIFFLFRPWRNKCLFSNCCPVRSIPRANKCLKSNYFLIQYWGNADNADITVP